MLSVSTSSRCWLTIDRIAKELSRTWDIVLRKNVFMNFNLEKLLSALATVTGSVRYSKQAVIISGKLEDYSEWVIKVNSAKSLTDFTADNVALKVILNRITVGRSDSSSVMPSVPDQTPRHVQQYVVVSFNNYLWFQAREDLVSISQWLKSFCYLASGNCGLY